MMSTRIYRILAVLGLAALAAGCGRGNGLPAALRGHLAEQGIVLPAAGSVAPLSSRAGLLYFAGDPALEAAIIAQFDLRKIEAGDPAFRFITGRVSEQPRALWGIAGRPARLKLGNGLQFEYLYLLTTEDGRTYLFAEYAYG